VKYAVEAWTVEDPDNEEPVETEMVDAVEFDKIEDAKVWAWARMEEGFFVRLWRR